MRTIGDSVKALFDDIIKEHDLESSFKSTNSYIYNIKTGATIKFIGLQDHNSKQVKGLEACDLFWGDEANQFSRKTLKFLVPTIRKHRSELWFSWNPEKPTDAIDVLRDEVKEYEPERAFFIKVLYTDNRFASEETILDAERDRKADYENYLHVWEGDYKPSGDEKLFDYKLIRKSFATIPTMTNTYIKAGLDVARAGSDKCVLYIIQGKRTVEIYEWPQEKDSYKFAMKVAEKCYQHGVDFLAVDSVGVGGPVGDHLRNKISNTTKVIDFDCTRVSPNPKYANLKADAMCSAMEWMRSGGQIPELKLLIDDLLVVEYDHNSRDQLFLKSKKKLKSEGIPSHDYADALAMAVWVKPTVKAVAPQAEDY